MRIEAWLALIGMSVATYATRFSGLWLMGRTPDAARFDRWLRHVPGAVLVSIVAPAVTMHGWPVAAAAAASAIAAVATRNIPVTLVVGVVAVVAFRAIG